jgi:transposase-like protein
MPAPYPLEFRREAVELLKRSGKSVPVLVSELGVSPQSLRNWARQIDIDKGRREGLSSDEREELRRLRRENRILAEEREILKKAAASSPRTARPGGDLPAHRGDEGRALIKTMCRVLGVSRSGFHAWARRPTSARALEDERLTRRIREIHRLNRRVYGSPRIHAKLRPCKGRSPNAGRRRG